MMTETPNETYNGWKNYPTWCVNLWLSNDEGLYLHVNEIVARNAGSSHDAGRALQTQRVSTADAIRGFVRDDLAPDLGASFAADLLGYALDSVDWFEIADAWIEMADEQ